MKAHLEWKCDGQCGVRVGHLRVYEDGKSFETKNEYVFHTMVVQFAHEPNEGIIEGAVKESSGKDAITIGMVRAITNELWKHGFKKMKWSRIKNGNEVYRMFNVVEPR